MDDNKSEKTQCWELLNCKETQCPVYILKDDLRCWLISGTHCRNEIQGKFLEKMEMCLSCKVFRSNMDIASMKKTMKVVFQQFKEYRQAIEGRDRELENMSMELALSLSEVFEALKKISSGDPTVRIDEKSTIELICKLKHMVNLTSREINTIVDQSHEFAIVLAEYFDVLHRVSLGDLKARVTGKSRVELLESLKRVMNQMIQSISKEISKREKAEGALRKAHDRLEHRVEERTTELRIINEKLWREIVVRKKIEEELREAELRYRTVADFTHDWEYWETPDGKLSYVSPSCERITGYSAEDFLKNSQLINEIVVPEDRAILGEHRHESNKVLAPQNIEFRIRTKDGELLWIEHVCQPVTDTHGTFLGVRASNRDITIRKKAEKNLRDTLSLLGATLESTADGIVVVDKKGKIISYNQKFLQMWGIPDTIIATRSDDEVLDFIGEQFVDREGFFTKVKELYSSPDIESFDILKLKDGKVFERYSQPQKIGTSIIGRVWSFRDVTERHLAEDALRESEQLLLQAHKMEAIGRLAAGVAHEINNPLAIINEKAGLMKDILDYSPDAGANREKFLGLLKAIFESVNRCRTITHRLLGFSRRTEISNALFNMNDALREVVQFLEKEIFFRNIHFEMNLREDLPNVISDKGQFEQVVLNILNNAIDVVEKRGHIEISTDMKDDNAIQVSVSDSGPGIPPDVLKHIFEPFFTTKEKGKGTGLGLSISYGIVQKLGGTIIVKSEVNRGTTFFIEIPVKAPGA